MANISYEKKEYVLNRPHLIKIRDCYEGNKAIKQKGKNYLKKYIRENEKKYNDRLDNSVFYNHFKRCINNLGNMLFRKGIITEGEDYPFLKNFDGKGSALQTTMKLAAKNALLDGITYLWVDASKVDGVVTLADLNNGKYSAYVKNIERLNVINWRYKNVNGQNKLSLFVIKQEVELEGDGFEPEIEEQYIVLEVGKGTVYRKSKSGAYDVVSSWVNDLDYIPIIPIYSEKTGYFSSDVPFLDLADMNLKHYNECSSLDSILSIVGNPQPIFYTGGSSATDDMKNQDEIVIGVNNALVFDDKSTGGAEYLEVEGKSIDKLENQIKETEVKMDKMSLSIIYTDTFKTATEATYHEEKNNLFLVELAYSIEEGFNTALKYIGDFLGLKIEYKLWVYKDFISKRMDPVMVDNLIKLRMGNLLSSETLWDNLIEGEILKDFDFDLEKEKILSEISQDLGE